MLPPPHTDVLEKQIQPCKKKTYVLQEKCMFHLSCMTRDCENIQKLISFLMFQMSGLDLIAKTFKFG
jgi:hypothetical protein